MNRSVFFVLLILCTSRISAQMRHFSIYVDNKSDFDLICAGIPEKGGGVFTKYTPTLKKHQKFAFVIESNKGGLPKGVEGILRFRLADPQYTGYVELYFDNPFAGSPEFKINTASYPFAAEEFPVGEINDVVSLPEKAVAIKIYVDTVQYKGPVTPLRVGKSSKPAPGKVPNMGADVEEPVPDIINFAWEVKQRMRKDDDDDHNGKAYNNVTYLFTADGKYAAVKPEDKSFSLMIYTPKGHTWMIDDVKKTIIVMSMPKTVVEGGMMGKAIAEDIKKSPLQKDRDDESFTITKSGKTKQLFGYTAEEYLLKNNKVNATKNAAPGASFWYAIVPFDPVKIYTMGVGRPADLSKMRDNPKMKNNIAAIPVLNPNYLWVETEAGGVKGLETISIEHKFNTIRTAGYTIKTMKGF